MTPYEMGKDAYQRGFRPWGSPWANPFRPGTEAAREWWRGLDEAAPVSPGGHTTSASDHASGE